MLISIIQTVNYSFEELTTFMQLETLIKNCLHYDRILVTVKTIFILKLRARAGLIISAKS